MKFNTAAEEHEFLKTASLLDVMNYHQLKQRQELEGKTKKSFLCDHGRVVEQYVAEGEIPVCSFCDKPMKEHVPLFAERTTLSDSVRVPLSYDKQGNPVGNKKVTVSRKAAQAMGY